VIDNKTKAGALAEHGKEEKKQEIFFLIILNKKLNFIQMKHIIVIILVFLFSCKSIENKKIEKQGDDYHLINTCWARIDVNPFQNDEVSKFNGKIEDLPHLEFKNNNIASLSGWLMKLKFVKTGFILGEDTLKIVEFSEKKMKTARIGKDGEVEYYEIWKKIDCKIMNNIFESNNTLLENITSRKDLNIPEYKQSDKYHLINTCWVRTDVFFSDEKGNDQKSNIDFQKSFSLQFKESGIASFSGWLKKCKFINNGFVLGTEMSYEIVEFTKKRMKIARIDENGKINQYEIWEKIDCRLTNDLLKQMNTLIDTSIIK